MAGCVRLVVCPNTLPAASKSGSRRGFSKGKHTLLRKIIIMEKLEIGLLDVEKAFEYYLCQINETFYVL